MIAIKLCATNDESGNPRRCYVVLTKQTNNGWPGIEAVIDEGYDGFSAVRQKYPGIIDTAAEFDVPTREYNDLMDRFGDDRSS